MATTTFMTLNLPVPTVTIGPDWASQLNTALERVDQHDHTSGNGVKITVPALDINTDLTFKNNNATNLNSTRYINNSAVLSGLQDIRCLYVSGGDLYYNNSSGTNIRITSGSALDASSIGGIGGDYATSSASVFYTNASDLFTFDQATNTRAKLDIADVTIREAVASAEGITIKSPTSLAASYNITLPAGLPGSGTKILTIDSSGGVGASYDVDNSTLEIVSDTLRVKDAGITLSKLAPASVDTGMYVDGSITTAKINNNAITRAKISTNLGSSNASSGSFSNVISSFINSGISATITPNSNNVLVSFSISPSGGGQYRILRNGSTISFFNGIYSTAVGTVIFDTGATPGVSTTYEIQVRNGSVTVNHIIAAELL